MYIPTEDIIGLKPIIVRKKKKFILQEDSQNLTNFMDFLDSISQERIRRMQSAIEDLAYSLQYSIPPESASLESRWTPPFRDGVDVIIDKMLEKARGDLVVARGVKEKA